jgi:hypothetical protein
VFHFDVLFAFQNHDFTQLTKIHVLLLIHVPAKTFVTVCFCGIGPRLRIQCDYILGAAKKCLFDGTSDSEDITHRVSDSIRRDVIRIDEVEHETQVIEVCRLSKRSQRIL